MKRMVQWITGLFSEKKEIIFEKEEIEKILPHRGRMLLLDRVRFSDGKAVGEFLVTDEVCEGHVIAGVPVMKGSDLCDMAAQLLGIMVHKEEEITSRLGDEKTLAALEYNGIVFKRRIRPGEKVLIETSTEVDYEERHGILKITGGMFFVRVDSQDETEKKKIRVRIASVTLAPVSPTDMK